jgi:hypothetical protein
MQKLLFWALAAASAPSAVTGAALSAASNDIFGLHARQANSCGGDQSLTPCGNNRPSNWCCPASNSQCLDLNNVGTQAVLCCPLGSSCNTIQTISCNTSLQDASRFPNSALHIANLTVTLPKCGSSCCALGYSCQTSSTGKAYCQALEKTLSQPQSLSSTTTPSTATPESSTIVPTIGSKPGVTLSPNTSPPSRGSNGKVIAVVVIPIVIIIIIAIIFGLIWFCRKSKSKRKISEPIYDPQFAARSDFLGRRSPQLSLSNQVSPMSSGTMIRPATAESVSPLEASGEKFAFVPVYPSTTRPLPKAPRVESPEMMAKTRGLAANQPPDQSQYYSTMTREGSAIKGTMSSHNNLYTLPNAIYRP